MTPPKPKRDLDAWKRRRLDYLLDTHRYDQAVAEGLIDPDPKVRPIR